MFILVKNSGAQMLLLNKIATKIQELSTFVNKKLPFISTFHYDQAIKASFTSTRGVYLKLAGLKSMQLLSSGVKKLY